MPLPSDPVHIPKIIHQLWKDDRIPEHLAGFVRSWRSRHPDWEYRLWTDADLDAFVAAEHPDFLPLFRGYRHPICRADAARYLILRRFGGLYVDLDFECFRPIGPLLEGASFAIGLEPAAHVALEKAVQRHLPRILCPSLIASVPGHPFWDHVLNHLRRSHAAADVLDATGPFMLTRALDDFSAPSSVTLLPAAAIYPATKQDCWEGALFDIPDWDDRTRDAYALHHWDGGWFRTEDRTGGVKPRRLLVELTNPDRCRLSWPEDMAEPRISALMVTRDRFATARLAVGAFRRQTYANRELIVVDDGTDDRLAMEIAALGDPAIRVIRRPDRRETLGALRNIAVANAGGSYVCQWDDDDLSDPLRLEMQMTALRRTGAGACVLKRWTLWWPGLRRFAVSNPRLWEGSLLCEKTLLPPYPERRQGEDTPVAEALSRYACIVHLDLPRLCIHVMHGRNTDDARHSDLMWKKATRRFSGSRADDLQRELERRVDLSDHEATLGAPADSPPAGGVQDGQALRPGPAPTWKTPILQWLGEPAGTGEPTAPPLLWSKGISAVCDARGPAWYWTADTEQVQDAAFFRQHYAGAAGLVWVRLGTEARQGRTCDLDLFVDAALPHITAPFVLVTTDGDSSVPSDLNGRTVARLLSCPWLKGWYTQNHDGTHAGRIKPFPIGLDLHTPRPSGGTANLVRDLMDFRAGRLEIEERPLQVLCDFAQGTPDRWEAHRRLGRCPHVEFQKERVSQTAIWRRYAGVPFVVSPRGNGLDCHRTWEALYLGAIVITLSSPLDPLFQGLPVVVLETWDDILDEKNLRLWKKTYGPLTDAQHLWSRLRPDVHAARMRGDLGGLTAAAGPAPPVRPAPGSPAPVPEAGAPPDRAAPAPESPPPPAPPGGRGNGGR